MMRRTSLALALACAFVVATAACSKADAPVDASSSKPAVPVATIEAEGQPSAVAADAATFAFDQTNSKIGFIGKKVTGSHTGAFNTFSGEVRLGKTEADSAVNLTIDMASLSSDNEKLTGHLKSPDFFDADQFKTATFVSTKVSATELKGNLTLHGVTKQVTFPAAIMTSPEKVSLKAIFALDRKAFNVNYPGKADDLIKDHVDLFLEISATPKAAAVVATPPAPEGVAPAAPPATP